MCAGGGPKFLSALSVAIDNGLEAIERARVSRQRARPAACD